MPTRRSLAGLAAGLLLVPPLARAQELPGGVVRLVVPFPPGGPADVLGRILASRLSARLGRTVVIENRAGAGGMVGMEATARMAPDGLTIGIATQGSITMAPLLVPNARFIPLRDMTFVSRVGLVPELIVVNAARVPARTLPEFLDLVRRQPGQITAASSGNGGIAHLAIEVLKLVAGAELQHVPYRGVAPAMNDLLAGQVDCMIADVTAFIGFLDDGKLRPIAVAAPERVAALPNVPTTVEAGMPEYQVANWYAVVAPRGTPEPMLAILNAAAVSALADPEVVKALADLGMVTAATSPTALRDFVEAETTRWAEVVRRTGARIE